MHRVKENALHILFGDVLLYPLLPTRLVLCLPLPRPDDILSRPIKFVTEPLPIVLLLQDSGYG